MESMVLGSPNSSDSVRGTPKQSFLPPYLLGSSQTPVRWGTAASSLKQTTSSGAGGEGSSGHHRVTWSPDLVQSTSVHAAHRPYVEIREHFGGPPVRSLSTDGETSSLLVAGQRIQQGNVSSSSLTSKESISSYDQGAVMKNASQMDPFYTQGEDFDPFEDVDDCCVTVFGFPAQSASYILQEFSQYGVILNYEIANSCNWMHLRYQSRLQAKKSLSKNAKIFNGTMQIGVTICIDKNAVARLQGSTKKLPNDYKKCLHETNLTLATSPSYVSNSFNDTSLLSKSQNPKASMRSLTSAYTSSTSVPSPKGAGDAVVVDKDEGIINRAWQYVFGW